MLAFRLTCDDDVLAETLSKDRKMLICKEGSDSEAFCSATHYHGICYEPVTRQTLRNWIAASHENYFYETLSYAPSHPKAGTRKPVGNKFYSIKSVDDCEGFERYVCKGLKDSPPNIVTNSAGVDTDERYAQYWRVNESYTRKVKKEKSKTYKQMFKDYILSKYTNNDDTRVKITLVDLIDEYRLFCMENDVEPTPRTSGETMFMYLLGKLNGDQESTRWYEYYGRSLMLPIII